MTTAAAAQGNTDAAADAAAAAAAAAAASKTPEQIAAEKKTADDAAAAATAAAAKKTADDAAAAAAAEAAKNKPPEKYEFKRPEGSELYLDDQELKALEARAKAKGLTQEQAQTMVNEIADERASTSAAFRAQTEADPTWGGDKLGETQRLANAALDRIAPKDDPLGAELRRDLITSGFANKLTVVAALARLGKLMAEDTPIVGAGGGGPKPGGGRDPNKLYDHPTSVALAAETTAAKP